MWNPFRRSPEVRESSYTDALVAQLIGNAIGSTTATPTATGALQAAAGMVSRCFAAAAVEGPANLAAAVTPLCLSTIGRALLRRGEIVLVIDVNPDGRVRLVPAADWNVTGDWEPETWDYRVNLAGPSRYTTRAHVPAAAVVHPRFEVDPDRPWRGVGPLQSAALAGRLSAETAAALADAESGPRGALLPLPVDGADPTVAALKSDVRNLAGKVAFVESRQDDASRGRGVRSRRRLEGEPDRRGPSGRGGRASDRGELGGLRRLRGPGRALPVGRGNGAA